MAYVIYHRQSSVHSIYAERICVENVCTGRLELRRGMISVSEYDKMSDEEKYYHQSVYESYRTEKYRAYSECEECGCRHYLGWNERKVPVGNIVGYEKIDPRFAVPYLWHKEILSHNNYAIRNKVHEYLGEE